MFSLSLLPLPLLLLHALVLLPLAARGTHAACAAVDRITVQLQYILQPQFAGYVAAQENGYYEEACLDVTLLPGGTNAVLVDENVRLGSATFAARWTVGAFEARELYAESSARMEELQGVDYLMVAQWYQRPPLRGITMADSGVASAADFAGRTVSYSAYAETEVLTAMAAAGVSVDEITRRHQGFTVDDVLPGKEPGVDVVHGMTFNEVGQLLATVNEETGELFRRKDFTYIEYNITSMLADGLAVDRTWLAESEENVDITRRLVKAVLRGWTYCRDEPTACANMFVSGHQRGGAHAEFMMSEVNNLIWPSPTGIGILNRDDIVRTMNLSREFGGVGDDVSYDDMFTNEFVEAAHSDVGASHDLVGVDFVPISYEFCLDERTDSFHICRGLDDDVRVVVKNIDPSVIVAIVIAVGVLVLVVLVLTVYFVRRSDRLGHSWKISRNWIIDLQDVSVGEEIGRGAFATVYKGVFRETVVAIKRFPFSTELVLGDPMPMSKPKPKSSASVTPSLLEGGLRESSAFAKYNPEALNRAKAFEQEIARVALLRHPHTLFMYGAAVDEEAGYMITELAESGTMHDLIHSTAPITWRLRVELAIGMAHGMAYLHSQNLLHGDIKPSNLLLDRNLSVKVGDFAMNAAGALPWMAPERIRDGTLTKASDVWSAGIVMLEMATRQDPFANCWTAEAVYRQRTGEETATPELNIAGPPAFIDIARRMLSRAPEHRPTFADVVLELETFLEEHSDDISRLDLASGV